MGKTCFSDLKIRKDYSAMRDSEGNEHEVYNSQYVGFCYAGFLHEFLTDPRWAWFDSVRDTPKYQEAVSWAEAEAKKEEAE